MSVTVRGTDILFNDGTTQSTAGQPTSTALVLSATAGASVGSVGTYAIASPQVLGSWSAGSTISGSNLKYSSTEEGSLGSSLSGTWRAMSQSSYVLDPYGVTVYIGMWLRIS